MVATIRDQATNGQTRNEYGEGKLKKTRSPGVSKPGILPGFFYAAWRGARRALLLIGLDCVSVVPPAHQLTMPDWVLPLLHLRDNNDTPVHFPATRFAASVDRSASACAPVRA